MPKQSIDDLYFKVFSTPAGEQVLDDLKKICTFTPNTLDSNDVFLRLGKCELLKYIQTRIERTKNDR